MLTALHIQLVQNGSLKVLKHNSASIDQPPHTPLSTLAAHFTALAAQTPAVVSITSPRTATSSHSSPPRSTESRHLIRSVKHYISQTDADEVREGKYQMQTYINFESSQTYINFEDKKI